LFKGIFSLSEGAVQGLSPPTQSSKPPKLER